MYLDYILFAVGGGLLLLAVVLAVVLLASRRRGREYRRFLQEETERTDVLETLRNTYTEQASEGGTEQLGHDETEGGCETERLPDETSRETELVHEEGGTARINIAGQPVPRGEVGSGLDLSPLAGRYELLSEIHGGGMSRVFLAKHLKLGSEWIVKYVDGAHAELAEEAEVLKKLNHISLPQIIDIFQGRQGTFLVERYIEGYTLEQVLKLGQRVRENQAIDWGLQLAQVLHYLHHLETPIIHCDLKPSNIMVTHDNRLVLIDFGISKREGISERSIGLTYRYAAPEQFRGKAALGEIAKKRFGTLPEDHSEWQIDVRTDLYSTGVILHELLTLDIPRAGETLGGQVTDRLAAVINRCTRVRPEERYQSARELADALEALRAHQLTMARSLVKRKIMTACSALLLAAGLGTTASAAYINSVETRAAVTLDPGEIVVTVQQGVPLVIRKTTQGGRVTALDPNQLEWAYSMDNIVRFNGDRIVGANLGETTLHGTYRNKAVALHVTVVPPADNLVSTALQYDNAGEVSVYAGNGEREQLDGTLEDCSMISPGRITADGSSFYFGDSGVLRVLEDGEVYSVLFEDEYLTTQIVWSYGPAFYILTGPWEEEDGAYYGILEVTDEGAGFIYYTEAPMSTISDIAFSSDGMLWFIQQNFGTGMTTLAHLDVETLEQQWVMDLPDGAHSMVFDEEDNLYISVPEQGIILRVAQGDDTWSYFAGVEGERNFIDGAIANFYQPTSLALDGDSLYVLDFDTVRRISIESSTAVKTETIAGVPVADTTPEVQLGKGNQCILPASELASIAINENGQLLLTDPKNSVIYEISQDEE